MKSTRNQQIGTIAPDSAASTKASFAPRSRLGKDRAAVSSLDALGNMAIKRLVSGSAPAGKDLSSPMAFPNADRILRSLGVTTPLTSVHDLAGCATRGVPAFTDGTVTHFASDHPGIHVAAHEAAHQLQHRGITHDAGLGPEGHACAVADAVAAGMPAAALVSNRGRRVPNAVRNYVFGTWKGPAGQDLSGSLSETGEAFVPGGQLAYATPGLISQASAILQAKRSGVHIAAGGAGITVDAPDGSGPKALSKVDVKFDVDVKGEGKFTADCRKAAKEIMGPHTEPGDTAPPEEILCQQGSTSTTLAGKPEELIWFAIFLDQRIGATPEYGKMTPEEKKKFQEKAKEDFDNLSQDEKEKLKQIPTSEAKAKELGIDKAAEPAVGEAFAVFKRHKAGMGGWDFHYAAVIMVAGVDRVTLENADISTDPFAPPDLRTANWHFAMYGPASKGQTFYDKQFQGEERHVVVVATQPHAPPDIGSFANLSTSELITRARIADPHDPDTLFYLKQVLASRRVTARVHVHKKNSWALEDRVSVRVGSAKTERAMTPEGSSSSFELSALSILPAPEPLPVFLYEGLITDSLMGSTTWAAPFTTSSWSISKGDARYTMTLSM